jgi:nucleotidyltransferase AbiEii toxin of type IV toxin-antitoxin system
VIPEPQRTYVLELLKALGPAAEDFVIAGAQAIKFMLKEARGTKDIDFVLDVARLREKEPSVSDVLGQLGYKVVEGSNNFQFEKPIPNSQEVMRVEFMAPEEFKRDKDFRVDIEDGIHARFCTGGSIAIAESSVHRLSGKLPDGAAFAADVRVTTPHALVMLKLLALDDRYRNIRGPAQYKHDREEARTHSADCIAVISGQADLKHFKENFEKQFQRDAALGIRVLNILNGYFRENTSPGLLVYEESIVADQPLDRAARQRVSTEIDRAHQMMLKIVPPTEFYQLAAAIEDSTNVEQNRPLVEDFLGNLKQTATKITNARALEQLPGEAFGGVYRKGDKFTVSASEALKGLSAMEVSLLAAHVQSCAGRLRSNPELLERFGSVLS